MYAMDPDEAKYQLLIIKREGVSWKKCNDSKTFIKYSIVVWTILMKLLKNTI